MAYFISEGLKEGLMCMEESNPFAFEKNPDTLMISDEDWILHEHETQA